MSANFQPTINVEQKVGARFKLTKRKVNSAGVEQVTGESGWSHNLVLDSGLTSLSTSDSNIFNKLAIGSGNSVPDVTQTTLQSFLAITNTPSPTQPSSAANVSTEPFYFSVSKSFRFNTGAAAGVVAELGITPNTVADLFNRALVRDNSGNVTTITVLSDEILDVVVELRVYFQNTISGSFDLRDKLGNLIRTVNYTGKIFFSSVPQLAPVLSRPSLAKTSEGAIVYSGSLNSGYNADPSGTSGSTNTTGGDITNSYPTNRTLASAVKFGLESGNFEHKSIVFRIVSFLTASLAQHGYQLEFDQAIAKTSSETLTYNVQLTWDRYVA